MQIHYLQVIHWLTAGPLLCTAYGSFTLVGEYVLSYFQLSCQSPIVVGGGVDGVGGGDTEGG
ncbi:MAG TPA: hypothetical protein PLQ57_03990, partial [Saprospiraceae bacterium]|nr:hypothetical protein [Saprospiraceae bacterium]